MKVWTVGHSTHDFGEFADLLQAHGIEQIADVRTVPKSRRHPHFAKDALADALPEVGIAYVHLPGLGGFRKPRADSPNAGWQNNSFRGYADYAMTDGFARALAELRELSAVKRTAIMCAESVWWRCHRRLVADRLVVAGDTVLHIASGSDPSPHELSPFALVDEQGQITYPPAQLEMPV